MSRHVRTVLSLIVAIMAFARAASASPIVYTNGAIDGTIGAWGVSTSPGFFEVSNSFTVSAPTTLAEAYVGLWAFLPTTPDPNTPATVSWGIGTTAFSDNISSGTSSVSSYAFFFQSALPRDVYSALFPINGVLGVGTYWFTLHNTIAANGDAMYWDINNGPSSAMHSFFGDVTANQYPTLGTNSSAFTLYG